jgi:hypothetical protein
MKILLYVAVMLISFSASASNPPEVTEQVIKAFKETFNEARNVSWEEKADNCYQAHFTISEITVRALYAEDGKLVQTIRYYNEKELPARILARFKSMYKDKQITGVTEVANDEEISYTVVLKDDKHWFWVKSDPYGNLEQITKLKNGEPKMTGF